MGADGKHGPRPYEQRQVSTLFLRLPSQEFRAITSGRKTEFRASPGSNSPQFHNVQTPTPVVAYMAHPRRGHDARLMVLEETWQEPIGAIRVDSLQREGQPDLAHFRRYWMARTKRPFKPTRIVACFRVRPWRDGDQAAFAAAIFRRLYGAFT